ncbi:hypothetical protein BDR26DRAFT_890897 [Obelidium mucronatum]|nr:hypothetical protein BDR26DRAFT_890897 [Obelidium mucronatum]
MSLSAVARRHSLPSAAADFHVEAAHFLQATMLARRLSLTQAPSDALSQPQSFPFLFPQPDLAHCGAEQTFLDLLDVSEGVDPYRHSIDPMCLGTVEGVSPTHSASSEAALVEFETSDSPQPDLALDVSPIPTDAEIEPGFDILSSLEVSSPPARQRRNSQSQESTRGDRFRATESELFLLTAVFAKNPFPSAALRDRTAEKLGLTGRQVQFWFQNRRATLKKAGVHVLKPRKGACRNGSYDGNKKRPSLSLLSDEAPFFFVETKEESST